MTLLQCETCTRRNIPTGEVRCPSCGGVDLRPYDPDAAEVNAEMLAALKRGRKALFDTQYFEQADLDAMDAAILKAEPSTAMTASIHGPECPGDCEVCENDADEKARPHAGE